MAIALAGALAPFKPARAADKSAPPSATIASDPCNQYLAISVGTDGRFNLGAHPDPSTCYTTAGSYNISYAWPDPPWSSFSTVRVDGSDYIYGTDGTQDMVPVDINATTNESAWHVNRFLKATQTLQIVNGPSSGHPDTALIGYDLVNEDTMAHQVGMRIMVDTMLNDNDGAPFFVPGTGQVTSETSFSGDKVPPYWQAFYSLTSSPDISSQGTLSGDPATKPDRFVVAYWPNITRTRYDFTTNPSQPVTDDSAVAMFWATRTVAAGGSVHFSTLYGLPGFSQDLSPPLGLVVTGPDNLAIDSGAYSPNPFTVSAFTENLGSQTATFSTLNLSLPAGLSLASGETATHAIGDLAPGATGTTSWQVMAAQQQSDTTLVYQVSAQAANAPTKVVSRSITIPQIVSGSATLSHLNPYGDTYYDNVYDPRIAQGLYVTTSGLTNANLYVDGNQTQSITYNGVITWSPPTNPDGSPLYTKHLLWIQGTDGAGNRVTSPTLTLYALVRGEGDAVSILPDGAVDFNPFSTDPFEVDCLNFVAPPAQCTGQPPNSPPISFRMINTLILDGKSDGTRFVEAPRVAQSKQPGTSFYCDLQPSTAARRTDTLTGPMIDSGATAYISTFETRVNVTIPDIFKVPTPPGTTGPTNQSPFIPWIFSSVYVAISPNGTTQVKWADQSGHTSKGNSFFPYHYLYANQKLVTPVPHPAPPDLVAWTRTADASPQQIINWLYLGLPFPIGWILDKALHSTNADIYAVQHTFAGELAECARQRFANIYQTKTPNLEDYLQQHFPGLPIWYPFAHALKDNIQPHYNFYEFGQGVAQTGFVRNPACVIPGCPGLEKMKVIGLFSPVSADVYDSAGHHSGPRPDGTIEQGIPSVTYLTFGSDTFLIVPNDATYRVQVHGTGSGTLTLDATDYDGKNKLAFQQYASIPVTPQSRGTLTIGDVGTPFSWDVSGSGNAAALTPTTSTTNPADDTTDTSAPSTTASVSGTAGQQGFYRSAVDVRLTASDDLSGVGRTDYSLDGGAIWTPYDGPLHITGDGAHQVLYRSVDYLGNQEAANTLSFTIDTVPPSVAINSPTARTYTLNAAVAAGYSCSDSGSGVATCAGPVASGDAVPTGSVGSKSFTVNATDRAGNSASSTVTYTVTYGICALYDQTKAVKAGSTVPIKLMLCDASGADVSAAGVVVSATGVTQTSTDAPGSLADSGNANPDNNFRFDATLGTAGGYIYNFSTANMITGTYAVKFRVANDPVEHTLSFQVK